MPAACRGEPIVAGSKGVCSLGRRARVHAPPEKGRQGARTKFGRPLEGGSQFPLQVDLDSTPFTYEAITIITNSKL